MDRTLVSVEAPATPEDRRLDPIVPIGSLVGVAFDLAWRLLAKLGGSNRRPPDPIWEVSFHDA